MNVKTVNSDSAKDYIFLQTLLGYGASNTAQVLENIDDINGIFAADESKLKSFGLTPAQIKRKALAKTNSENVLKLCAKEGIKIITIDDNLYPDDLKHIFAPPVVLYALGDMPDLSRHLAVTVVGTRSSSDYGKQAAFSLCARLSLAGAVIVSGDAIGGDSFSHLGALAVSGKTIAVTGGGVLSHYLAKSEELRRKIVAHGGVLVSEFQPTFMPHGKGSFHIRNRILAGISQAVAVTEAGASSGALITAHIAAEEGKNVFAMPGRPNDPVSVGTNKLISEGATPLLSPSDILLGNYGRDFEIDVQAMERISAKELKREYMLCGDTQYKPIRFKADKKAKDKNADGQSKSKGGLFGGKTSEKAAEREKQRQRGAEKRLSGNMLTVYRCLSSDGDLTDDIVKKTGLGTSEVLSALTKLEIFGLAKSMPGSKYSLK